MRKMLLAAALFAAGAVGVWLSSDGNSATQSELPAVSTPSAPTMSMWEMHNMAHLEFLPVQPMEDQSVVFHQAQR
jgi:hypothetical protein